MPLQRRPFTGRTALALVLIVLIFAVCAAVYFFLTRLLGNGRDGAEGIDARTELRGKLAVLLLVLMCAALAILAFAVGAYLLIHVGRTVARRPVGGKPTEYSDAWSQYRISDEQIAAATGESRDIVGDDDGDDDSSPDEGSTGLDEDED